MVFSNGEFSNILFICPFAFGFIFQFEMSPLKEESLNIAKKYTPKENSQKDYLLSFTTGGLIGLIGEAIRLILIRKYMKSIMLIIICSFRFFKKGALNKIN